MKTWEVVSALASSGLFAWGGLLAQAAPVTTGGPNVEAWIGTGGSLGILGSLLYYLVTKHNPRQDERYDKLVADNSSALKTAQSEHSETMKQALMVFKSEMESQRVHHEKTFERIDRLVSVRLLPHKKED